MKKILTSVCVSVLLSLSSGCSVTSPKALKPTNIESKVKEPEYTSESNESNFQVRRRDGAYFECDYKDCTFYIDNIRLVNKNFKNSEQPIVDQLHIPGFSTNDRYWIDFLSDPEQKRHAEDRYRKADKIYTSAVKEFKIKEAYKKWIKRPDILDKYK